MLGGDDVAVDAEEDVDRPDFLDVAMLDAVEPRHLLPFPAGQLGRIQAVPA